MDDTSVLLKPAELASRLGLSTGRIYQLIATGVIPAVRIGGAIRVPLAAWELWLEEQRDKALQRVLLEGPSQ